jgi:hypothetical protein
VTAFAEAGSGRSTSSSIMPSVMPVDCAVCRSGLLEFYPRAHDHGSVDRQTEVRCGGCRVV